MGVLIAAGASWLTIFWALEPTHRIDALLIATFAAIAVASGLAALVPPEASHIAEAIERARKVRPL